MNDKELMRLMNARRCIASSSEAYSQDRGVGTWSLDRSDSDVVYVEASVASFPRVQPIILREVEVVKRL